MEAHPEAVVDEPPQRRMNPLTSDLEPDPTIIPTTLRPLLDGGEGKLNATKPFIRNEPYEREETGATMEQAVHGKTPMGDGRESHHDDESQNPLGPALSPLGNIHRTRSNGGEWEVNKMPHTRINAVAKYPMKKPSPYPTLSTLSALSVSLSLLALAPIPECKGRKPINA